MSAVNHRASAYASVSVDAPDADAVSRLASDIARRMRGPGIVFLSGELGAGKTHWTRALLRALGETSPVPSPTFPLAQTYRPRAGVVAHHLDFYRLSPGEWREAGMDEFLDDADSLRIVEWPERAVGLPRPDLTLTFRFAPEGGRVVLLSPGSEIGEEWVRGLG